MRLFILIIIFERFPISIFIVSIRFHSFHKFGYDKAKAVFITQLFIVKTVVASGFIGAVAQFI